MKLLSFKAYGVWCHNFMPLPTNPQKRLMFRIQDDWIEVAVVMGKRGELMSSLSMRFIEIKNAEVYYIRAL